MRDIENREDLEIVLRRFYSEALVDEMIGHHFERMNLDSHLPLITNFWDKVLFGNQVYFGEPFLTHQVLDAIYPLEKEHFNRWLDLFDSAIDEEFSGTNAESAKSKARRIADNMYRSLQYRKVQGTP